MYIHQEIEHRKRFIERLVWIEWRYAVSDVRVLRMYMSRDNDVVGQPDTMKSYCLGALTKRADRLQTG